MRPPAPLPVNVDLKVLPNHCPQVFRHLLQFLRPLCAGQLDNLRGVLKRPGFVMLGHYRSPPHVLPLAIIRTAWPDKPNFSPIASYVTAASLRSSSRFSSMSARISRTSCGSTLALVCIV
jgi:hypothetical protein